MKRIIAVVALAVMLFSMSACARKIRPDINIKTESVTALSFKRTVFSSTDVTSREYMQKRITEQQDIKALTDWISDLRLEKHDPIEVPVEMIEYFIILEGKKEHTLIFYGDYVVYDATAYTFKNSAQRHEVVEKYNMLNYEEQQTELELF